MKLLAVGAVWIVITGCAVKRYTGPMEYQYRRQDLVVPPGSVVPSRQQVDVKLGKARLGRKRGAGCEVKTDTVRLAWEKSAAKLHLDITGTGNPSRVPLSQVDDINRFREALVALERNGCLRPGEAGQLASRMLHEIALPSRMAYSLRYGNLYQGFIDVQPPLRLRVVVPLREGAAVGFETAWYRVENGRLIVERAEASVKGVVSVLPKPNLATIKSTPKTNFYRIFFLTRRSANDHDILLLTSKTIDELDRETQKIKNAPESACRDNPACILVPQGSAISVETPVMARGQKAYVPVSGTVSDALRAAGVRQPNQAKNVTVLRPFGKALIPVTTAAGQGDILGLVLIGGEQLNWE